ncbi:hypothetical protein [Aliiruegeria sabulilitoris]|uniref:hypothetical protein n=1 Tax=Aliiruegeria sabulilitoris TaxID=1510458 RepID=UPI000836890F|nr:hypothetical protein [Aliiruegeria sabulilitoris]NDR59556.1 hypothetical protein [Pseudoruegeria sp. M32A2M]
MPKDLFSLSPWSVFVNENSDALVSSARLLGGPIAERRVLRLINELSFGQRISTKVKRELDALEDLLSLRHVDNPDREAAGYFAMIHPASREADRICDLLEKLQTAKRSHDFLLA